jgi:hypothetical protein
MNFFRRPRKSRSLPRERRTDTDYYYEEDCDEPPTAQSETTDYAEQTVMQDYYNDYYEAAPQAPPTSFNGARPKVRDGQPGAPGGGGRPHDPPALPAPRVVTPGPPQPPQAPAAPAPPHLYGMRNQGSFPMSYPFQQRGPTGFRHAPMGPPVPQAFWQLPGPTMTGGNPYLEDDNSNPPRNAQDARKRFKETVATFPYFDGRTEQYSAYLARVRLLREQYSSWNDMIFVQMLVDRLKDKAVITYTANQREITSLQQFMAIMESYHGDRTPLPLAQNNFHRSTMTAEEIEQGKYRAYFSRLLEAARRAYPQSGERDLEEKTVSQWLNSITPPEVREQVWRMSQTNNTKNALIGFAENEYIQRSIRAQQNARPQDPVMVNAVTTRAQHAQRQGHGGAAPHQPAGNQAPRNNAPTPAHGNTGSRQGPQGGNTYPPRQHLPPAGKTATMIVYNCLKCGQIHAQGYDCPHETLVCWACLRPGHFKRQCPNRKNAQPPPPRG